MGTRKVFDNCIIFFLSIDCFAKNDIYKQVPFFIFNKVTMLLLVVVVVNF